MCVAGGWGGSLGVLAAGGGGLLQHCDPNVSGNGIS